MSAGPAVKHDTAVVEIAVQSRPIASEELSSVPIAPVAKVCYVCTCIHIFGRCHK